MILIVGLGNPGRKFENTRHNLGFKVLDNFAEKNNFPDFEFSKKSNSLLSESILNNEKIILAKPQTFMNDSGKAVKEISRNNPDFNLIVVHDDIDLPVGKMKIIKQRSSAGHKGVESIMKSMGNKDFVRIRVGIRPARAMAGKAGKIVLKKFAKDEQKIINAVINKSAEALDFLLKNGLEKAMNEYNKPVV